MDMRKLISIAEGDLNEFVEPVSWVVGATGAGLAARAGYGAAGFAATLRRQEAAQLYHHKKWTIDQLVQKYWPRIKAGSKRHEKLRDKVKQWVVWRGHELRPGDERSSWIQPDLTDK